MGEVGGQAGGQPAAGTRVGGPEASGGPDSALPVAGASSLLDYQVISGRSVRGCAPAVVTDMGHIVEVQVMERMNREATVIPLSKDEYLHVAS